MRGSHIRLATVKPLFVGAPAPLYKIPNLSSIIHEELPGNGFGSHNYAISMSSYKHWPVYLNIQNTKISTDIRKITGDANRLKLDLLELNPTWKVTVNAANNSVRLKGDHVATIKLLLNKHLLSSRPIL